ncbi:MAG: hypothetical protein JWQ71_2208 [Pedosphaera sp.]|nr:hypothetical protein [Pedosphaera sp.]
MFRVLLRSGLMALLLAFIYDVSEGGAYAGPAIIGFGLAVPLQITAAAGRIWICHAILIPMAWTWMLFTGVALFVRLYKETMKRAEDRVRLGR